jgi:SAM-dependent methyltransferase
MNTTFDFYEALSQEYEEQFPDWERESYNQAVVLDGIIRRRCESAHPYVLDCACGVGTQAIGLARVGYRVFGTDLSHSAIAKAKHHAERFGLDMGFCVCSFAGLSQTLNDRFDVILCCDNALPHLLKDEEISEALTSISSRLVCGGLFIASIRDYDQARATQCNGEPPRFYRNGISERIRFQIWEWNNDATYTLHHFLFKRSDTVWTGREYVVMYRGLLRGELTTLVASAGFEEIEWIMPEQSGFYQPVLIARAPRSL